MKQLSGLDASFLYLETGSQFGHVSSLSIYAKPEDDSDYDPFAAWRGQIERRLHLLEPLRRRLRECRSASTTPTGSRIPTSTSTSTSATVACHRPGVTTRSPRSSPGSSGVPRSEPAALGDLCPRGPA